jgi:type I restriction enzyme, R subunit
MLKPTYHMGRVRGHIQSRGRNLVQLIDKRQRRPVYTDFEDLLGAEAGISLPGFVAGTDRGKFVAKARAFLRQHLDHVVIAKLRMNRPLTASDLAELERILAESGVGNPDDIRRAADASQGLGLFVRSLIGMDRRAAKDALAGFIDGRALSANQLEFVNLVVDHLTEHGLMQPARLYESPFTDLTPRGPDGLFNPQELDRLIQALDAVRATAVAA